LQYLQQTVCICCVFSYKEYCEWKSQGITKPVGQTNLESFIRVGDPHYNSGHPRQIAINDALVNDLIIGCSLPLSLVENTHFRHFLHVLDPKYTPPARSTITTSKLPNLVERVKKALTANLAAVSSVSLTVDIWTDRKMRAYFGCTVHYINVEDASAVFLSSQLLSCSRITGRHTGESIAAKFDQIVNEFGIRSKVAYVLTDNAANMRKAFQLAFPVIQDTESGSDDDNASEEDVDSSELWNDLDEADQSVVESSLDDVCSGARLACFAHTEQLVVGDGFKEIRAANSVLAKCSRLATLLHTSSTFKDHFEEAFGRNVSISAENTTRWNSKLRLLKGISELDQNKLNEVLSECGHKNLVLTARESSQLMELINILLPFQEATDLTQGKFSSDITH
jgi:hypothetical protein